MGALVMSFIGTRLAGPGPLLLLAGLVLGAAAGGGYAAIAAAMRFRRGVPEVISTLLLVFVAFQVVGFAITTDWLLRDLDPSRPSQAVSSAALPEVGPAAGDHGAGQRVPHRVGRSAWRGRYRGVPPAQERAGVQAPAAGLQPERRPAGRGRGGQSRKHGSVPVRCLRRVGRRPDAVRRSIERPAHRRVFHRDRLARPTGSTRGPEQTAGVYSGSARVRRAQDRVGDSWPLPESTGRWLT